MDDLLMLATSVGPIILLFAVFYFIMVRPQKKKEQAINAMRNALEVGDQITTIGGVIGTVIAVRDDKITIETGADRVKLHFTKWAIQSKTPKE